VGRCKGNPKLQLESGRGQTIARDRPWTVASGAFRRLVWFTFAAQSWTCGILENKLAIEGKMINNPADVLLQMSIICRDGGFWSDRRIGGFWMQEL
jgi:hypothetical protein